VAELDDEAEDIGFRLPLPPDDRLWRHPSELDGDPAGFWSRLRHQWRIKRDDGDARA
jgi:hypothetical protein